MGSEGGCLVRDELIDFIAPFFGGDAELYGIVYPTPPTFAGNIMTTDDGPLLLFDSPSSGHDLIVVVQTPQGAWHVSAAIFAAPGLVNPDYLQAEIIDWD